MLDGQVKYSNRRNNNLYIAEASIEYFISLLFTGAYFAKLTSYIGMSDGLTGILTSFVTLGSCMQIVALFLHNKVPVKRWVTLLHLINQLCFTFIYVVPIIKVSKLVKTIIFVILLFIAYFFNSAVHSAKITWYMSFVEDKKRGIFTANKEIVSLVGGIIFSYLIGFIIDGYEAKGELLTAFVIGSIVLFVLTISHTLVLLFTQEKPAVIHDKEPLGKVVKTILKDKNVLKVIGYFCLNTIASSVCTPFYGTYQIKELGLTLTFVATIVMVSNFGRTLLSRFFGRLADKTSFIFITFLTGAMIMLSYGIVIFTSPKNGMVMFAIYYLLHGGAMAGANSASLNLIYDVVDESKRTETYALKNAIAGLLGFVTTTIVATLVSNIQANGGVLLFGINLYAQQFVSIIGATIKLLSLVYIVVFWKISFKPKKIKIAE